MELSIFLSFFFFYKDLICVNQIVLTLCRFPVTRNLSASFRNHNHLKREIARNWHLKFEKDRTLAAGRPLEWNSKNSAYATECSNAVKLHQAAVERVRTFHLRSTCKNDALSVFRRQRSVKTIAEQCEEELSTKTRTFQVGSIMFTDRIRKLNKCWTFMKRYKVYPIEYITIYYRTFIEKSKNVMYNRGVPHADM